MPMDRDTALRLVEVLEARSGIVAAVGAGGKKTTLHRLLEAHLLLGTSRVALTATVQTGAPPERLDVETCPLDPDDDGMIASLAGEQSGAFFLPGPKKAGGRFSGLRQSQIKTLHQAGGFDVTLVKADGARMRMIKAPGDHEPALPVEVTTILPIVSSRVIGRPLSDRIAHRTERLADLLGISVGDILSPDHLADLLISEDGALRAVGDAVVIPVINMVDGDEALARARETALSALSKTRRFDRILLAVMASPSPLVEVVSTR